MANTICEARNGTYACQLDATHIGRHEREETVYDANNYPVRRKIHMWVNAFSPIRTANI